MADPEDLTMPEGEIVQAISHYLMMLAQGFDENLNVGDEEFQQDAEEIFKHQVKGALEAEGYTFQEGMGEGYFDDEDSNPHAIGSNVQDDFRADVRKGDGANPHELARMRKLAGLGESTLQEEEEHAIPVTIEGKPYTIRYHNDGMLVTDNMGNDASSIIDSLDFETVTALASQLHDELSNSGKYPVLSAAEIAADLEHETPEDKVISEPDPQDGKIDQDVPAVIHGKNYVIHFDDVGNTTLTDEAGNDASDLIDTLSPDEMSDVANQHYEYHASPERAYTSQGPTDLSRLRKLAGIG
jgi:hypothetical protein